MYQPMIASQEYMQSPGSITNQYQAPAWQYDQLQMFGHNSYASTWYDTREHQSTSHRAMQPYQERDSCRTNTHYCVATNRENDFMPSNDHYQRTLYPTGDTQHDDSNHQEQQRHKRYEDSIAHERSEIVNRSTESPRTHASVHQPTLAQRFDVKETVLKMSAQAQERNKDATPVRTVLHDPLRSVPYDSLHSSHTQQQLRADAPTYAPYDTPDTLTASQDLPFQSQHLPLSPVRRPRHMQTYAPYPHTARNHLDHTPRYTHPLSYMLDDRIAAHRARTTVEPVSQDPASSSSEIAAYQTNHYSTSQTIDRTPQHIGCERRPILPEYTDSSTYDRQLYLDDDFDPTALSLENTEPETPKPPRKVVVIHHPGNLGTYSRQNFNGPFFTDDLGSPKAQLSPQSMNRAWIAKHLSSTLTRQEDFYQSMLAARKHDSPAMTSDSESADQRLLGRLMVPMFENLLSYVEGPIEQRKDYWAPWVGNHAPEWAFDRSATGNDSFIDKDWGNPPARIGRDSRYQNSPRAMRFGESIPMANTGRVNSRVMFGRH